VSNSDDRSSHSGSFFGRNLRRIRLATGLTQTQLASRLGHSNNSQVAKWESGRSAPRPATISRVAQVLEVERFDLVRQDPPPQRAPESLEHIAAVVAALLQLGPQEPASARTTVDPQSGTLRAQAERIAHLVRGLSHPEALDAVERVVVEHLSKQLGAASSTDGAGPNDPATPALPEHDPPSRRR